MNKRQSGNGLLIVIISVAVVVVLVVLGFIFWQNFIKSGSTSVISSYEDCKKAPESRILETYPEQCVTIDGQTFTGPVINEVSTLTYCSTAEKLCFEYRDDWKLETLTPPTTEPGALVDNLRITSPDDSFGLLLTSGISGLGGTCPEEFRKDVYILASMPITTLTGYQDEYNQDSAEVTRVVYQNEAGKYIAALYVTTSPDYAKPGTLKTCGTGFSQYVNGKNSKLSADFDGAGAFRFGYTGSDFYDEKVTEYETLEAAKAAYETDNYVQAAALMSSLHYE